MISKGIFATPGDLFLFYALKWVGTPYHWGLEHGGDDFAGMDCSGFLSECLQASGLVKHKMRLTAAGWYKCFVEKAQSVNKPGMFPLEPVPCAIQFHQNNENGDIYHCNICLGDKMIVGAIGGNSETLNDVIAAEKNAFVKIRPYNYVPENKKRKYLYVNPFVIMNKTEWQ